MARLVIVGTGYVGLVTGACLADAGHHVTCQDIDPARVRLLRAGQVPVREPGLDEVVRRNVAVGRLDFTADLAPAMEGREAAILAVGTPTGPDGLADLRSLHAAADAVAKAAPKDLVLVLRSTVPPGTGDALQARLAAAGRPDIQVVNAPEFLAEGTAVRDFLEPDRLVFGGPSVAVQRVEALWRTIRPAARRFRTDRATAEAAKYAANTFLAARVSLINEMANLCDAVGADVRVLADIVGTDARIGPRFLRPGVGYGGSCFPKDVQALVGLAAAKGIAVPVAQAIEATNEGQWKAVVARVLSHLPRPAASTVAILGIAFKPDTDDTRSAPAVRIGKALRLAGCQVRMHDPVALLPADAQAAGITQAKTPEEAMRGADLVLLATEWREYAMLPWDRLAAAVRKPIVLDGRNALPWQQLVAAGWSVEGIGARPGAHATESRSKAPVTR